MKVCGCCRETKDFSLFGINKCRKDGFNFYCKSCKSEKEIKRYHENKVLKPKVISTTKVCGSCKVEFPKTKEFFFTKKYKQKLADGTFSRYQSFRSTCKKCHSKDATKKNRLKRCKELNCTLDEYESAWRKQAANTNSIYNWIDDKGISITDKRTIIRYIRNGYVFTTFENFLKEKKKIKVEAFKKKRKGKSPIDCDFIKELSKEDFSKYKSTILSDSKMANWMGMKLEDCPKEMIEARRMTYKINRLIKEIS